MKTPLTKVLVDTYFNVEPTEKQKQLVELLKHQAGGADKNITFYYHQNGEDVIELDQHIFQGSNHFNLSHTRYEYYTFVKESTKPKSKSKKK